MNWHDFQRLHCTQAIWHINRPTHCSRTRTSNLLLQTLHNADILLLKCQPSTPTNLAILSSLRYFPLLDTGLESATAHVEPLRCARGRDVEVEDVHWEAYPEYQEAIICKMEYRNGVETRSK